jgi:hypothetical protein
VAELGSKGRISIMREAYQAQGRLSHAEIAGLYDRHAAKLPHPQRPAERRRAKANVAPIGNPCQLDPIASPCRFERFQALAQLARGSPIANGEWRMVRSASPFAIRYSPFASYRPCATFLNEEKIS